MTWIQKLGIAALLSSALPMFCVGQVQISNQETVRLMFDEPGEIQWIKSYAGMIDALHPVSSVIAFDGKTFKGQYTLNQSGLSFDIIGSQVEEREVRLEEIDNSGLVSGYWIGDLSEDRFDGTWWSSDFTRQSTLRLVADNLVELKKFQPSLLILDGKLKEHLLQINLFIEDVEVVSGIATIGGSVSRVSGICTDAACESFILMIRDKSHYQLQFSKVAGSKFRVKTIEGTDEGFIGTCNVRNNFELDAQVMTDYTRLIDGTYPQLGRPEFDQWITQKFTDWFDDALKKTNVQDLQGPATRWEQHASAWSDISYVSEKLVSGILTFFDPMREEYTREAFVYDLQGKREMDIAEYVRRGQDLQSLIAATGYEEGSSRYVSLLAHGLLITTDFDSVEGDEMTILNFDILGETLKVKALTRHM